MIALEISKVCGVPTNADLLDGYQIFMKFQRVAAFLHLFV